MSVPNFCRGCLARVERPGWCARRECLDKARAEATESMPRGAVLTPIAVKISVKLKTRVSNRPSRQEVEQATGFLLDRIAGLFHIHRGCSNVRQKEALYLIAFPREHHIHRDGCSPEPDAMLRSRILKLHYDATPA